MVIPGKDAATTIGSTLQSVARQGFAREDVQVVVVDDGSEIPMAPVVEEYAGDLAVEVIRNEEARGVSAARNRGLEHTTGRYITFLDSDDWYGHGHLRNLVDTIEATAADWVKADYVVANGNVRRITPAPCAVRDTALDPRDFINPVNASSMVDFPNVWSGIYRSDLKDSGLLRFDESLRTSEDRLLTWQLHLHTASFAVARSYRMFYRKGSETSLTGIFDERQLDFIPAFGKMFDLLEETGTREEFGLKMARSFLGILHFQRKNRYASMPHDVRHRLRTGAVDMLRQVPTDLWRAALVDFGDSRVKDLKPVLREAGVHQ
ncbi:glycosyltransferase family 2 protein [Brevibacterium litoralis]|uniref:glycosyltransferase family 2 protein n=1 Tax=Brevibacterium litoralis TaxID=3138935 RepID=UPI0032EF35F0